MVKEKKSVKNKKSSIFRFLSLFLLGSFIAFVIVTVGLIYNFEKTYQHKIYPGVRIDGISFSGKNPLQVENFFKAKSQPFKELNITFTFEDKIATLSGTDLELSFDGKLSGVQAFAIGRSGYFLSNLYQKWRAATEGINLPIVWKMNSDILDETLGNLANSIDIAPADALFQFESGKVTAFKPAESGRRLNQKKAKELVHSYVTTLTRIDSPNIKPVAFSLPIDVESPKITTENSNQYGIKELIGVGSSKFKGSISGRVANIVLSASRINGHLIPPGSIFSFNDTLGDVSASTGFQPAYIIKSGRTVLGDGGGVCQVSTTLFRAALDAGLPIVERNAHSYRVSYYEQDSSPGIDATVFAPSYDLKFKNNTDNYILIQAKPDAKNYSLIFEIYGTSDGRLAEITKPTILSQTPPPPDLFQDDPNLPVGEVKQVDFRATGAKVNFDYKVVKSGEVITQQSFFSNFAPWQAVFLRGTRT